MEPILLEPLESPTVLPDFVSCYSARLPRADHRLHFRAGRECVARAMARLGLPDVDVPHGPQGQPIWPAGVTGSITHKRDFVFAAVARTHDVLSIGIDAEDLIEQERAARISSVVMLPQESFVGGSAVAAADRIVLLFSIKEALFKCLYPLVLRRFYYDAIAVTDLDVPARRFEAALLVDLSHGFERGTVVSGSVQVDERRVYSGTWISSQPVAGGRTREDATI